MARALRWFSNPFLEHLTSLHPLLRQGRTEVKYYSDMIQLMLNQYSVTILAESRWPLFEGLTLFQRYHYVAPNYLCNDHHADGLVPWNDVRTKVAEWSQVKRLKIRFPNNEEVDIINLELERYVAEVVQATLGSKNMHAHAEVQCPLALMMVACIEISSAANRYSEYVPNFEAPVGRF